MLSRGLLRASAVLWFTGGTAIFASLRICNSGSTATITTQTTTILGREENRSTSQLYHNEKHEILPLITFNSDTKLITITVFQECIAECNHTPPPENSFQTARPPGRYVTLPSSCTFSQDSRRVHLLKKSMLYISTDYHLPLSLDIDITRATYFPR